MARPAHPSLVTPTPAVLPGARDCGAGTPLWGVSCPGWAHECAPVRGLERGYRFAQPHHGPTAHRLPAHIVGRTERWSHPLRLARWAAVLCLSATLPDRARRGDGAVQSAGTSQWVVAGGWHWDRAPGHPT